MKTELLPSVAKEELGLVLSFFPRVDAKASVVLAVDTAMAGYLAGRLPAPRSVSLWEFLIPIAAFVLISISFVYLYKGAFPNLKGGNDSLVYFREIAKRTEAKFLEEFAQQSESEYGKDLLGQAWRNSEILVKKFHFLKCAFVFMALAVIPWTIALAQFAMKSAALTIKVP